jgi:hypothetical protein
MHQQRYTEGVPMPIPPSDPRDPAVADRYPRAVEADDSAALSAYDQAMLPTQESVDRARAAGAKEAIRAICDVWPDGFEVLLHRDRLRDKYGDVALNKAFDEILDERRR